MCDSFVGLLKPKSYFFLSIKRAGPVLPSSESCQLMATFNCDWRGSWALLKKVKLITFAMSTRFEVVVMESLMGSFIGVLSNVFLYSTRRARRPPGLGK